MIKKFGIWASALVVSQLGAGIVVADIISLNFSENSGNQILAPTSAIGPLGSANWNSTDFPDSGNLTAGSKAGLVDDIGNGTGVSVTWTSGGPWFNGDGTSDDEHKLAVGYLDDGGSGLSVTFNNIPYAQYRVYGLLASDQNTVDPDDYAVRNFTVNGAWVFGGDDTTTRTGHGTIDGNFTVHSTFWTEMTDTVVGNYWTFDSSGSTLTVAGQVRNGAQRGSLTGIIIEQIPEPTSIALLGVGAFALLLRRRRR